jgi:hypothetical protein
MRSSALPDPGQTNTSPLRAASADRAESAYLLPKDRCDCQRSGSADIKPTGNAPHSCAGEKELVPEAQRSVSAARRRFNVRDRRPHPKLPPTYSEKEQPLHCGVSDPAPEGTSLKGSFRSLPRECPPRGRHLKWCLSAPVSSPCDPASWSDAASWRRPEVVPSGTPFKPPDTP